MNETKEIPKAFPAKICQEVAEAEFDRFCKMMYIDSDVDSMADLEDRTTFEKQKKRLVEAIRNGDLVINDDGKAVYTPCNIDSTFSNAITWNQRNGATTMAADGVKDGKNVGKMYAMWASMTKTHSSTFTKLAGNDIKICESIFLLLMD